MNSWDVEKRIKIIKDEMMTLLKRLSTDYHKADVLTTEAQFLNKVFHELNDFYKSIGSPTLQVIEAWGPPYSEDHNLMIQQSLQDLTHLVLDIESIIKEVDEINQQVTLEEEAYKKRLRDIENHIDKVASELQTYDDLYVFQDHFGTMKFFNVEGSNVPASISTAEQLLTLRKVKEESFNEYAKIRILKGNGFPGNSKIAYSTGEDIVFEGENRLRTNLAEVLDGNIDTWFEFEHFSLTELTIDNAENKGFEYEETLQWATRTDEPLRLVVQLEFEKERLMNWVSILPHIPYTKGSVGAVIEKVVVEDSAGRFIGHGFEEKFDIQKAYMIGDVLCKRITFYLRQEIPYQTTIGHPYFIKMPGNETTVMDIEELQDGVRVHGLYPSIENLEVSYDKGTQDVVYPTFKYGDTIENEEDKKERLFNMPSVSSTGEPVVSGMEVLTAKRFAIGIKDIHVNQNTFSERAEYVSYPFVLDRPAREISLSAIHQIPEVFGDGTWVKYYISVDSGHTWNQIYDQISDISDAKIKYFVNTSTSASSRTDEFGYLETGEDVMEVLVKIEITRPSGSTMDKYTPIVHGYELQVLV